jgi:hypothetical protein
MKKKWLGIIPLLILIMPGFAGACTPILVGIYFLGPGLLGSLVLSSALGILLAVVIKIIIFLIASDYKSINVVWMMLVANLVSTGFGICIMVSTEMIKLFFIGLVAVWAFFLLVGNKMQRHKIFAKFKPVAVAWIMTAWYFVIIALYGVAQAVVLDNPVQYWIFKILMSVLAMGLTLLFSVVVEEAVIAGLYKKIHGTDKNFLKPVLWANIVAFAIVFGLAAVKSLPIRLKTPGFLNPKWD